MKNRTQYNLANSYLSGFQNLTGMSLIKHTILLLFCVFSFNAFTQVEYTAGGTANALTLTYPANITTLTAGLSFTFKAGSANSGAVTLAINGLTAVAIKKEVSSDLAAGDIKANQIVTVVYDGTNFQMITLTGNDSSGGGTATSIEDATADTYIDVDIAGDGTDDAIHFYDDNGGGATEFFKMDNGRLEVLNTGNSVFIGEGAGAVDDLSANANVFIGKNSGVSTTSGDRNASVGYRSMHNNVSGARNTAFGYESLFNNTTSDNVAVGYRSLYTNTSGIENNAFGNQALYANTTGNNNVAVGRSAMIGNTVGGSNTAVGRGALYSNVTGSNATAIGHFAMYYADNTATPFTNYNVAVGYEALRGGSDASLNTGNNNIAVGYQALKNNTSGDKNTGTGFQTLALNSTGEKNSSYGYLSLNGNTTGSRNTAYGFQSGSTNTTGTDNTFIGHSADASTAALVNATAIGAGASVDASNKVQIGDGSVTDVMLGTGTSVTLETGSIKLTGGTPGAGKVLTSDATGLASWQTAGGGTSTSIEDATADTYIDVDIAGDGTDDAIHFYDDNGGGAVEFFKMNNGRLEVLNTGQSVFMGDGAGASDDLTNNWNVFVGANSGNANTTGERNVSMGFQNFVTNTTGSRNTAIGFQALRYNSIGNENTAIGYKALQGNTGGSNVAMGWQAMHDNTSGVQNVGIGNSTLENNNTGNENVALGHAAAYNTDASSNIAIGHSALHANVAGRHAVAIGRSAQLYANNTTSGYINTNVSIGFEALRGGTNASLNTGNQNTAIGYQTLRNYTSGDNNTAMGYLALTTNAAGLSNTAIGASALRNATKHGNTAVGKEALGELSTGYWNTAVGDSAGMGLTTGYGNAFIGYNATASSTSINNATAIGWNATVGQSNAIVLGNSSVNVGIGTSTPSVKLDVVGNATTVSNTSYSSTAPNAGVNYNLLRARGTEASPAVVSGADNIGTIGAFGYGGAGFLTAARIDFDIDAAPGASDMPGRITFSTTPDNNTGTVERMRIDNAGNVGIGVTSPSAILDVSGPAIFRYNTGGISRPGVTHFSIAHTGTMNYLESANGSTPEDVTFQAESFNFTTGTSSLGDHGSNLYIKEGGNIGIGKTNPAYKLDVNGGIAVQDDGDRITRVDDGVDLIPILYGVVAGDGTKQASGSSSEWSVVRNSQGDYTITYSGTRTFSGLGEVMVQVSAFSPDGSLYFATYRVTASKTIDVFTFDVSDSPTDVDFSILAYVP